MLYKKFLLEREAAVIVDRTLVTLDMKMHGIDVVYQAEGDAFSSRHHMYDGPCKISDI